ncbi:uncharacterized protein LOC142334203 [Lycorma delicatula]|uniref:uncharacterized protein LOC142334203 n=1 Tax=Lycorma delicatula TaxID=130591 RepID=UPI003F50E7F7
MFTLWYIYLGVQEFRRRGFFKWLKLSSITDNLSSSAMASKTEPPVSSKADISTSDNQQKSIADTKVVKAKDKQPPPPTEKIIPTSEVSKVLEETKSLPSKSFENEDFISKEKIPIIENASDGENLTEEDDDTTKVLQVKDSKLLLKDRKNNLSDKSAQLPTKVDKMKISLPDNELQGKAENVDASDDSTEERNTDTPTSGTAQPPTARGRVLVKGSDEPMRCWLTEGDHPSHPAGANTSADNIKVITNRARDSADSILRDSDELITNERHVRRKTSWPKKVSISEEPPTTFIREIPPAENPEIGPDPSPVEKLKREAELAAAAAAALKEDWRRKMERKGQTGTSDLDDDENIIFGDTENKDEGQILQISDEESSENGLLSDRIN